MGYFIRDKAGLFPSKSVFGRDLKPLHHEEPDETWCNTSIHVPAYYDDEAGRVLS